MLDIEDMQFIVDVAVIVVDEIITRLPDPDPRMRHNWRVTGKKMMRKELQELITISAPIIKLDEDAPRRRRKR